MSKADASRLVREASQVVKEKGRHLIDVIREKTDAPVDWDALRDESIYLGSSEEFINRVLRAFAEG